MINFFFGMFVLKVWYPWYCAYKNARIQAGSDELYFVMIRKLDDFLNIGDMESLQTRRLSKHRALKEAVRQAHMIYGYRALNDVEKREVRKVFEVMTYMQVKRDHLKHESDFLDTNKKLRDELFSDGHAQLNAVEAELNRGGLLPRIRRLWRSYDFEIITDVRKRLDKKETEHYDIYLQRAKDLRVRLRAAHDEHNYIARLTFPARAKYVINGINFVQLQEPSDHQVFLDQQVDHEVLNWRDSYDEATFFHIPYPQIWVPVDRPILFSDSLTVELLPHPSGPADQLNPLALSTVDHLCAVDGVRDLATWFDIGF